MADLVEMLTDVVYMDFMVDKEHLMDMSDLVDIVETANMANTTMGTGREKKQWALWLLQSSDPTCYSADHHVLT